MNWRVQYARTFLKDTARLPQNIRKRVEAIAFGDEIEQDPFLAGQAQKLSGYHSFYKIRVGDYRIGLQIDIQERTVQFQCVLHRREIYRRFP